MSGRMFMGSRLCFFKMCAWSEEFRSWYDLPTCKWRKPQMIEQVRWDAEEINQRFLSVWVCECVSVWVCERKWGNNISSEVQLSFFFLLRLPLCPESIVLQKKSPMFLLFVKYTIYMLIDTNTRKRTSKHWRTPMHTNATHKHTNKHTHTHTRTCSQNHSTLFPPTFTVSRAAPSRTTIKRRALSRSLRVRGIFGAW